MTLFKNKKILETNTSEVVRRFEYKKGGVKLDFSLRIDIKQRLKDFRELLVKGIEDIDEQLKEIE